jgi:zinc protease
MAFLLDHADEKTFASQREVVKNERRQNYENAPYGLVYPMIRAAMYPKDHPYHLVTIGTPEDLDRASMDDVRGFFKTWYVPNNATLVLAGDIDKAKAKELVQKWFGPIVRGPDASPRTMPMPVALDAEKTLKIEADVELPRISLSWPTPPQFSAPDADLDVLAHVLSSGKSSRLYKRLVYDLQIAQDVSAYQASAQLSSTFEVVVTIKKGKSVDEVLKVVDEELAKMRATPAGDAEVERARAQLLSHLVFDVERVTARANMLNQYNQGTGDPGFIEKDVARYQAVTPAGMQKTATTFLPEKKRIVAIVVPTAGAPRAGRLVEAK